MFGYVFVSRFIVIGSHNLHMRYVFIMLLFLQFSVSFASILNMIAFALLCCELKFFYSSFMVVSVIDAFPLFSCWEIFHC